MSSPRSDPPDHPSDRVHGFRFTGSRRERDRFAGGEQVDGRVGDTEGEGAFGGHEVATAADAVARKIDGGFDRSVGVARDAADHHEAHAVEGGAGLADEFTPGPAELDALVRESYLVGRNLLVRFESDDIDQSYQLARLFVARFTDDVSGIGGRIDFKKLAGTHVTPNAPRLDSYLDGLDMRLAEQLGAADAARALRDAAGRATREQQAACEVIAEFAAREARRAQGLGRQT